MSPTFTIADHKIEVANSDKIFFPAIKTASAVTKGDVISYYRDVACLIVPHLRGRPLTLERFPDGIEGDGFIQKSVQAYHPDWIPTVRMDKRDGEIEQPICEDAAALVYFADQGTITFHSPLGTADRPDNPDQMIFDLDPPGDYQDSVRRLARALRDLLDALSLPAYIKSSGSRGFHIVVPLRRQQNFDWVREFAGEIAAELVRRHPDTATIAQRKKQRHGRIFVDTLRNAYGQTAAAPYTLRALPQAPVACPLHWRELDDRSTHPQRLTIHNVRRRIAQTDDPWRNMREAAVSLEKARDQLRSLVSAST
jgi:bifunctional non-homologous end joining protein LigD